MGRVGWVKKRSGRFGCMQEGQGRRYWEGEGPAVRFITCTRCRLSDGAGSRALPLPVLMSPPPPADPPVPALLVCASSACTHVTTSTSLPRMHGFR
eukprot:355782-Chlamydomonas_euryale.AAC.12